MNNTDKITIDSNISNSKQDKFLSFILLFISLMLLSILLTYNSLDSSFNSTFFNKETSSIYKIRNIIADVMFQVFGVGVYLIPIFLLVYSYKLFNNIKINLITLRIISFLLLLILNPIIIYNLFSNYKAGLLGYFLNLYLPILWQLWFLLIPFLIFLLYLSLNINIRYLILNIKVIFNYITLSISTILTFFKYLSSKKNLTTIRSEDNINIIPDDTYLSNLINQDLPIINAEEIKEKEETILNNNLFLKPLVNLKKNANKEEKIKPDTPKVHNPIVDANVVKIKDYAVSLNFLNIKPTAQQQVNSKDIKQVALTLEKTMQEFGVSGKIVNIQTGPVVTLYEISIPAGVKTSKLISLETDIALRMKAVSVRIAIVPGKDVIGIELPNSTRKTIYLKEILQSDDFKSTKHKLPITLGLDAQGKVVIEDLASMPHALIAGTTGSGKSVGINTIILSLLYKFSPENCKLIMIDPKMLELSVYQDIPHLLTPVVTDPKKAVSALKWAVKEMEFRYYQMSLLGVRNISGFNEKILDTEFLEKIKTDVFNKDGVSLEFKYMPYIVVIIDEMADLMIVAGKEVESAVQRLAQMARAAGIHLIMATQRPSVDVITGTIKANFPTRISFQVSSKIDSRTILNEQGAEQLLGKGDMLYMSGVGRLKRVHGPFVADDEVSSVANYLRQLASPNYISDITTVVSLEENHSDNDSNGDLLNEAISIIQEEGKASTSLLQRKLGVGYNRASILMDTLQEKGIVSKANATGKREILIK